MCRSEVSKVPLAEIPSHRPVPWSVDHPGHQQAHLECE